MKSWQDYFQKPTELKLYIIHSGYVHMSGNIHFNKKSPKFKSMPKDNRFKPVLSYFLDHPKKGKMLIDTGLHHSFVNSASGNCGWLLGKVAKTKTEANKDVVNQLKSINIDTRDIRYIILSHLHFDHPSSLPYFSSNTGISIFADKDEQQAAASPFSIFKGYVKSHLKGAQLKPMQYDLSISPFDHIWDFFGDGSVFIIKTAGHTPGHVSVLLNSVGGPILLTFDTVHRESNLKEMIPPIGDYKKISATLEKIKSFVDNFPQIKIIYGHDPDQLEKLKLIPKYYS